MKERVYSIIDMKGYATTVRESVAESFAEDYTENLDNFITLNQTIGLIKKKSLGKDKDGYYMINDQIFDDTFDEIRSWIYGVGLSKLAASGYVECAWDSKSNEMTFWLPDKDHTTISSKPSDIDDEPRSDKST